MLDYITSYLKSDVTPGSAGNMFWAFVYIVLIFLGLSVAVIAMNWLERKILAHMQVRLGPMRVGPHGLLQPIADALKLLIKEDIMPAAADPWVFWAAPLLVVITAFTVFIVVPFGPTHAVTDMNIGVLFMLGVSSLSVLGVFAIQRTQLKFRAIRRQCGAYPAAGTTRNEDISRWWQIDQVNAAHML